MMQETTDIVITTCERLPLLKRTLSHIWERTTSPYRLHVIDDASTGENAKYLKGLEAEGRIDSLLLRKERSGVAANLLAIPGITQSDPLVFSDDDILCPELDPDWLSQGLEAMRTHQRFGMLALNNPQADLGKSRKIYASEVDGVVTRCRNVGGTFVFIRRSVLETYPRPDTRPYVGKPWGPIHRLCLFVAHKGYQVGYLTHVYCQHIGATSILRGDNCQNELNTVLPVDDRTLAPPKKYRRRYTS